MLVVLCTVSEDRRPGAPVSIEGTTIYFKFQGSSMHEPRNSPTNQNRGRCQLSDGFVLSEQQCEGKSSTTNYARISYKLRSESGQESRSLLRHTWSLHHSLHSTLSSNRPLLVILSHQEIYRANESMQHFRLSLLSARSCAINTSRVERESHEENRVVFVL